MKTQFQNQTRGCIGEEFDLPVKCRTERCPGDAFRDGYCLKCYEQRQAFLEDAAGEQRRILNALKYAEGKLTVGDDNEPYRASQYDWRWLYVPCAAAIALIALLWWLWPRLIALRMGDGQP